MNSNKRVINRTVWSTTASNKSTPIYSKISVLPHIAHCATAHPPPNWKFVGAKITAAAAANFRKVFDFYVLSLCAVHCFIAHNTMEYFIPFQLHWNFHSVSSQLIKLAWKKENCKIVTRTSIITNVESAPTLVCAHHLANNLIPSEQMSLVIIENISVGGQFLSAPLMISVRFGNA